jgi:hypothetical protein
MSTVYTIEGASRRRSGGRRKTSEAQRRQQRRFRDAAKACKGTRNFRACMRAKIG